MTDKSTADNSNTNPHKVDANLASIRRWLDELIRHWHGRHVREDGWDLWELPPDGRNPRKVVWLSDEKVLRVTDDKNQDLPKSREELIGALARAGIDTGAFGGGRQGWAGSSPHVRKAGEDADPGADPGDDDAGSRTAGRAGRISRFEMLLNSIGGEANANMANVARVSQFGADRDRTSAIHPRLGRHGATQLSQGPGPALRRADRDAYGGDRHRRPSAGEGGQHAGCQP
jgi:hypothetical protein